MKNIVPFPEKDNLQDSAIQWLVKMEDGDWTERDKAEFHAWLASDPRHREIFLKVASFWGEIEMITALADLFPREKGQKGPRSVETGISGLGWIRPWRVGWVAGLALCFLLVAVLMPAVVVQRTTGTTEQVVESVDVLYETRLGEQTRAVLNDGSIMTLNTLSRAKVRFDDKERIVYLESGEAHFEVAKNKDRPFSVYAEKGRITAVGTAFSVRIDEQQVNVTVSEGSVEVTTGIESKNTDIAKVQPVSTVILNESGIVNYRDSIEYFEYIEPEKIENKLAWKGGKLAFKGETLEQVITETNRYTQQKLEIADPSISNVQIGGYLDVGDLDQLLALFKGSFGIEVIHVKDNVLYLASSANIEATNH